MAIRDAMVIEIGCLDVAVGVVMGTLNRSCLGKGEFYLLSFPWGRAYPMPVGGLMRDYHSTLTFVHRVQLVLLLYFDDEVEILSGSVINHNVVRQNLIAS